MPDIYPQQVLM